MSTAGQRHDVIGSGRFAGPAIEERSPRTIEWLVKSGQIHPCEIVNCTSLTWSESRYCSRCDEEVYALDQMQAESERRRLAAKPRGGVALPPRERDGDVPPMTMLDRLCAGIFVSAMSYLAYEYGWALLQWLFGK